MVQYPGEIELSTLDGATGFRLGGFGNQHVAPAGDLNGDGLDDLILSAGYAMFGKASAFSAEVVPSMLSGSDGYEFGDGAPVASAGDVNGDGKIDVFVQNGNRFYVVFGSSAGFANIDFSGIDGSGGFELSAGASFSPMPSAVAAAGDVNDDGFDDVIVGMPTAPPGQAGASYLVFGAGTGLPAMIDLHGLDGSNGFRLSGAAKGDFSGRSVSSAGDINGDGFADIIVGAHQADPHGGKSGSAYVVFGKASGFVANLELSSLDGSNGFRLDGGATGDRTGFSVACAGDVNGDGLADLIIGAPQADPRGNSSGASYVVFGKRSAFDAALDLSRLDGRDGFKISGNDAGIFSGFSVAGAGDVNGDGFADVIIGVPADKTHGFATGASYVVFGRASGFGKNIDLSDIDGTNGFKLTGESESGVGFTVSSAGDLNGDGFAELIVASGPQTYIVLGRAPDVAVKRVGAEAAQTLAGGSLGDQLFGLGGDDRLHGNAGDDTLDGGDGDDWISGGRGVDVLNGSTGDDIVWGGLGGDNLRTGLGNDTVVCASVKESTGGSFDTIIGFDAKHDVFDIGVTVAGIDPTISTGRLSDGDFQKDLATAVNAATLLAQHAVMFVPDRGAHAGERFLIVDANGIAGYQANADFVFRLDQPHNLGKLSGDSFV